MRKVIITLFVIILVGASFFTGFFTNEYLRVKSTFCGHGTIMGGARQNMNTYKSNFIHKTNFPLTNGCDSMSKIVQ